MTCVAPDFPPKIWKSTWVRQPTYSAQTGVEGYPANRHQRCVSGKRFIILGYSIETDGRRPPRGGEIALRTFHPVEYR
jgi:hypothetical protein